MCEQTDIKQNECEYTGRIVNDFVFCLNPPTALWYHALSDMIEQNAMTFTIHILVSDEICRPLLRRAYVKRASEHRAANLTAYEYMKGLNIYGSRLQKLPTPDYVVLYNGEKDMPDFQLQWLSEAFDTPERACEEMTVKVYNINRRRFSINMFSLLITNALPDVMVIISSIY